LEPQSLTRIVSEEEFLPLVQESSVSFFKTFNAFSKLPNKNIEITRKFYSNLIQEADLLESFMDEYGARQNQTWSFFTEYIACIRNLVKAAFYTKHILDRYPAYRLRDSDEIKKTFFKDGHEALSFLNRSILNLYDECIRASGKNNLVVSPDAIDPNEFTEVEVNKQLPKSAEDDIVKEDEDRIIDLFEKMSGLSTMMESLQLPVIMDPEELKKIVPGKLDEKKVRNMMSLIHSVQSEFDTYVKNTRIEQKHKFLKDFRGYISMPLHLLEIMIWLCHFYERHEDEIRHGECKKTIATLVNKSELLSQIVNFCYKNCLYYIREGDLLSKEILKSFIKTVQYELPIPQPLGFHARPSTYISLIVRKYDLETFLLVDGEKFNCKSVMSLLQAGGAIADKGYQSVLFEGDKRVLNDIKILSEHNYCEDEDIPEGLSYLRTMREPS